MTPAARLQAAIEILTEVEHGIAHGGPNAGTVIARYFKSRRYAGAKDRTAIAEQVYDVTRARARHLWRLDRIDAKPTPRALAIAALAADGAFDAALFSGEGYGPDALSSEEREIADKLTDGDAPLPPWAALGVPEWLYPSLKNRFGEHLPEEMAALDAMASTDIRANTLKADRDDLIARLATDGQAGTPTPFSPLGLRFAGHPRLTALASFADGLFEVQGESAQIAGLLVDAAPGHQVLDLCAGAGGKTLALAAAMQNKGQIYAADTSAKRLEALKARARRADARNIQIRRLPSSGDKRARMLGKLAGAMDRVVVDAPCSGSGTWRRHPDLKWRLAPDALANHQARQLELLREGAAATRPGGRLVYMTCSILAEENDDVVAAFLGQTEGWTLLDTGPLCPAPLESGPAPYPEALQLTPARHQTDGFFVAVLKAP